MNVSHRRFGLLSRYLPATSTPKITSQSVEFLFRPLNLHPVQLKTIVDKFAAVGILQGYLDFANRSKVQDAESRIFQNENDSQSL